ncbi:MAG: hypothetical protein KAI24_07660, partial [Planctomycetes bacterium]|nr:hypothetical protein [Planctomycetota bacterium]
AAADDDDDDGQPTVGASRKVAPELVERLARFALVDNVRGQTLPFATAAVAVAQLRSEVIGADGARVTLRLTGRTAAATDGSEPGEDYWRSDRAWPRSVRTELLGEAVWDREQRRFVRFELVALGERTGRTTFNGRSREPQDTPRAIGFLLRLAPEGYRVAPTFVNLYGVSWIAMPAK